MTDANRPCWVIPQVGSASRSLPADRERTLTSNERDVRETPNRTHFRTLRHASCDWLSAVPRFSMEIRIQLELGKLGRNQGQSEQNFVDYDSGGRVLAMPFALHSAERLQLQAGGIALCPFVLSALLCSSFCVLLACARRDTCSTSGTSLIPRHPPINSVPCWLCCPLLIDLRCFGC